MIDLEKLPTHILGALRKRHGVEDDDTSEDAAIAQMCAEEAFCEYCNWHGLLGWGLRLANALDLIRAASDEVSPEVIALRARVAELEAMIDAICFAETTEAQEAAIERITALRAKW